MSSQSSFGFAPYLDEPRDNWRTPTPLFNHLNAEFGFSIDAAANQLNAKLPIWFGPDSRWCEDTLNMKGDIYDGLLSTPQRFWLNPPFSMLPDFTRWACVASDRGHTVVMIIPANRTDQDWFHNWVWRIAEIRFIHGRTEFVPPPGVEASTPSFACMLAIYKGVARAMR